jgi:cation diffusion facilitator CzcD-associated flavoprotein CzcO
MIDINNFQDWSKDFAAQPEILEYMKSVAKKFDVYKHIKFRHKIHQLKWEDKLYRWKVTVKDLISQEQQVAYYDIV